MFFNKFIPKSMPFRRHRENLYEGNVDCFIFRVLHKAFGITDHDALPAKLEYRRIGDRAND